MATPLFQSSPQGPPPSSPPPSIPQQASSGANKNPSSAVPRSRSVQFSNSDAPMSRSISPRSHSPLQQQQAESSADEITPIVNRERGGARNKKYDSTPTAQFAASGEPGPSRHSSSSSARRKKAGQSRSASKGREVTAEEGKGGGGWWRELAEKYGTVELENKGSVARDHLALERTFLAWLRTSLAFASIGIAVTQLFRLNTTISEREGYTPTNPDNTYHLRQVGKPLGATFLGIAIVVLLVGGRRYFESQVCQQAQLESRGAMANASSFTNPVLDHKGSIPRQQRQRLPYNLCRSRFDRHQSRHCLRSRSERLREEMSKAWSSSIPVPESIPATIKILIFAFKSIGILLVSRRRSPIIRIRLDLQWPLFGPGPRSSCLLKDYYRPSRARDTRSLNLYRFCALEGTDPVSYKGTEFPNI